MASLKFKQPLSPIQSNHFLYVLQNYHFNFLSLASILYLSKRYLCIKWKAHLMMTNSNQLMNIFKILLLAFIPLILCQAGYQNSFADAVNTIRSSLSQVSLVGEWKLLKDSNFVINKKQTMINEVGSQVMRNNDKLSFISSDTTDKEAEAYFESSRDSKQPKTLYIQLYDGKYYQNNTVALEISLAGFQASHRFDGNTNLWNKTEPIIIVCMLISNKEIIAQVSTHARIEIYTNAKETDLENKDNRFYIKFESDTISFTANLGFVGNRYSSLVRMQVVLTVTLLIVLVFKKPNKSLYSISEWMILQAFGFVIAISWIFIRVAMEKIDTNLKYVGLCAFINICLALIFLRNYEKVLQQSFKSKYERMAAVAALLAYFFLCYKYEESLRFWILQSFCLLALQINYSYSMGGRGGLTITLVFIFILMRFPYFYYRFFCPQLTREPTDNKSLALLVTVNVAMLMFIVMQRYFGSRFMIMKELIPDYFNYFQKLPINDPVLEQTCPICSLKLNEEVDDEAKIEGQEQSVDQPVNNVPTQEIREKEIMITPCDHKYHKSCMIQWMEKRLICPMCRSTLPPLDSQRSDSYCC